MTLGGVYPPSTVVVGGGVNPGKALPHTMGGVNPGRRPLPLRGVNPGNHCDYGGLTRGSADYHYGGGLTRGSTTVVVQQAEPI